MSSMSPSTPHGSSHASPCGSSPHVSKLPSSPKSPKLVDLHPTAVSSSTSVAQDSNKSKPSSQTLAASVNEVAFLEQQMNFMDRLKISNVPNSPSSSVSPKSSEKISASPANLMESPRVTKFRRKFPSANRGGEIDEVDGRSSCDAFEEKANDDKCIEPVPLINALDNSEKMDEGQASKTESAKMQDVVAAKVEKVDAEDKKIKEGIAAEEEKKLVPSQAASIARMWLSQARQALEYQKLYYDQYYGEEYEYPPGQAADGGWPQAEGTGFEDEFDIYNYDGWAAANQAAIDDGGGVGNEAGQRVNVDEMEGQQSKQGDDESWEGIRIASDDTCNDEISYSNYNHHQKQQPQLQPQQQQQQQQRSEDINEGWDQNQPQASPPPLIVKAVAAFASTDEAELGFESGALIAVINEDASGWWYGFIIPDNLDLSTSAEEIDARDVQTKGGWFPKTFVTSLTAAI